MTTDLRPRASQAGHAAPTILAFAPTNAGVIFGAKCHTSPEQSNYGESDRAISDTGESLLLPGCNGLIGDESELVIARLALLLLYSGK